MSACSFAAYCAVVAGLVFGLSLPTPALGKTDTREAFTPVGELPDGLSVVYVFRKHRDGKWLMSVVANGRLVGALPEDKAKGTYLPLLVGPGELVLDPILTPTGFEKEIIGVQRAVGVTLEVQPGNQYYVVKSKWDKPVGLKIADAEVVGKHLLKSVRAELPPGYLGHYHYHQADVFVDLAFSQDRAGQREAAMSALRMAARHYDLAASGFKVPIPKKKWHFWRSLAEFIYLGTAYDHELLGRQERVRRGRTAEAAFAAAEAASVGDVVVLEDRMDELSNLVAAGLACYAGEDELSLEQCWGTDTPETP